MTVTLEVDFSTINCLHCGMIFAVPGRWQKERRRDHKDFWCPGCRGSMCYPGKSNEEKLRAEIAHEREISAARAEQVRRKEYQYRAAKGQLTKFKKRVGKGVCPCCNRHFKNLAQHMESQHPDLLED